MGGRWERVGMMLTRRQHEIAALVVQGLSNKQVARRLQLSEGTVKVHLHNIYGRLGIANRTALAVWAFGRRDEPSFPRAAASESLPLAYN
jgi:DNA-binding NarL/FixJ family response regulator